MAFSILPDNSIDAKQWDAFAASAPGATLYHLSGWKAVIEDTFSHSTFYLSAVDDSSRIVGILPLAQLKSRVFGNMLVSLPFFNYGGVCASSEEVRRGLLDGAIRVATERKVGLPAGMLALRAVDPGFRTETEQAGRSLKGQLKQADRIGAFATVILGDTIEVKNMETGEQREAAAVDDVVGMIEETRRA